VTDESSDDDIWINAFSALGRIKLTTDDEGVFDGGAEANPDTQPLVDLLRSDMPMPASARDTLAELLSPGNPPYMNWRLVPETIKRRSDRQATRRYRSIREAQKCWNECGRGGQPNWSSWRPADPQVPQNTRELGSPVAWRRPGDGKRAA